MEVSGYEEGHISTLLAENPSTGSSTSFGTDHSGSILRMVGEIRLHFGDRMEFRIETCDDESGGVLE